MRNYGSKRVNPHRARAQMAFVSAAMRTPANVAVGLQLTLKAATPSRNEADKHHWSWRGQQREMWDGLLLEALSEQHAIHFRHRGRKAHVRYTRVARGTFDYSNLVGGTKQLEDTLVARCLLVDDSPAWVTSEYDQRRCTKGELPHTIVNITWETP